MSNIFGAIAPPSTRPSLSARAAQLANRHAGSKSIDGCGHAAVYGQGGHEAVADRESFEPEWRWQAARLAALAREPATP